MNSIVNYVETNSIFSTCQECLNAPNYSSSKSKCVRFNQSNPSHNSSSNHISHPENSIDHSCESSNENSSANPSDQVQSTPSVNLTVNLSVNLVHNPHSGSNSTIPSLNLSVNPISLSTYPGVNLRINLSEVTYNNSDHHNSNINNTNMFQIKEQNISNSNPDVNNYFESNEILIDTSSNPVNIPLFNNSITDLNNKNVNYQFILRNENTGKNTGKNCELDDHQQLLNDVNKIIPSKTNVMDQLNYELNGKQKDESINYDDNYFKQGTFGILPSEEQLENKLIAKNLADEAKRRYDFLVEEDRKQEFVNEVMKIRKKTSYAERVVKKADLSKVQGLYNM